MTTNRRSLANRLRDPMAAAIFILPVLVLFVVFRFVPIAGAGVMSFQDVNLGGDAEFIGVENYERLLSDPVFWHALFTTFLYVLIYVPMLLIVALVSAVLLNSIRRAQGWIRGALFLPYTTSLVLAGVLWLWVYAEDGLINGTLDRFGLEPIPFLSGGQLQVLASLAIVSVWRGFGYSMLILLAGLKNIPSELLEAASIDGASPLQKFFKITLPLLRPSLFFVLIIETAFAFQVFDTVYVMTGGGPARASYVLGLQLYDVGFAFFDFGYAATIGVALFVIVLALSLIQRRVVRSEEI